MKLSDAILKGCEMTPKQSIGWTNGIDATCAMGAAVQALFGGEISELRTRLNDAKTYEVLIDYFPILRETDNGYSIFSQIITMNDRDCSSREEIAQYIAMLERKLGFD